MTYFLHTHVLRYTIYHTSTEVLYSGALCPLFDIPIEPVAIAIRSEAGLNTISRADVQVLSFYVDDLPL